MKTTSLCNKRNPTNANAQKLKKSQKEQINTYQKEKIEYIQVQINRIRNSVEERPSRIAWKIVNEVSKRKSISRAKLKAANQEERIQMWKEHFKNLLVNSPNVTDAELNKAFSISRKKRIEKE